MTELRKLKGEISTLNSSSTPLGVVFILDNFTDANGTALPDHDPDTGDAGSWSGPAVGDTIQNNRFEANAQYNNSTDPQNADYSVKATIVATATNFDAAIVAGRWVSGGQNGYSIELTNGISDSSLILSGGGQLDSHTFTKLTNGQVVEIELRMSGTSISGFLDGQEVVSAVDSASPATGNAYIDGAGFEFDQFSVEAPGVFTGTAEDMTDWGVLEISVYSDVASATDGLSIQQSSDGTNWDHTDEYTVPAATGKNYSIQRIAQWFRIVYTNGGGAQSVFRLQTIKNQFYIKPSSHRVQDNIATDDDAELSKAVLSIDSGDGQTLKNLNAQHPLTISSDSVFEADIDQDNSSSSGFTGGTAIDLFNDRTTTIINSTASNPKTIVVELKRPVQTNILGFSAASGNFSNTKIVARVGQGADAIDTTLIDESADATDKTLLIPQFAPATFSRLTITFSTADAVSLSTIGISKALQRIARLQGISPSNVIKNVSVTEDGYLSISDQSSGLSIAIGNVTKTTFIHKFGAAPNFDTGDGVVAVWDGADDANIDQMVYQYSSTDDIDSISSSNAGDTQDIEILGLDVNFDVVTQTRTLSGQTRVALSTDLLRVFRMKNVGTTDNAGHVYCYVNGAITAGVPDTPADVRAVIQPGNNQTLMAIYTIPDGKTGYMRDWFAALGGASRSANYTIELRARPTGQVFQLKHLSAIAEEGSSTIKHDYVEPEVFAARTDIEMRVSIATGAITAASIAAGFDLVLIDD